MSTARILGLDVARGLAILGMAGAHVGEIDPLDPADPSTWTDLVNGRSSILFAVLAGISIVLMTGRHRVPEPDRIPSIRLQLLGRGAAIFVIGLGLELLNTPVAIILSLYGLLYIAVIPFLRWQPGPLLLLAGGLAVVGPLVLALLAAVLQDPSGAGIGLVLYGSYPITVWMVFVLAGMALGRLHVERTATVAIALGIGVGLMIVGYGIGIAGASWSPEALFGVEPHSGGTAEIVGSGGFAVTVIALCVLLSRPLRWVLMPLAALGSMPLTAYSAHVLSIAIVAGPGGYLTSNVFWAWTAVGLLAATTAWSIFLGRGPLERVVGAAATRMAAMPKGAAPPVITGPRLDA